MERVFSDSDANASKLEELHARIASKSDANASKLEELHARIASKTTPQMADKFREIWLAIDGVAALCQQLVQACPGEQEQALGKKLGYLLFLSAMQDPMLGNLRKLASGMSLVTTILLNVENAERLLTCDPSELAGTNPFK